ncbi:hypothetical protein [Mesorhizobium sp. J428]|uniref:hypothetical protein n=1 Tax=Mesorhizobium sp. J428 TaxID=2898440 RepID=UPI00215120D1|nr:hypothetical protein [Mesorhizobium sp. J428]MCR5856893.1 hypothetical protein [Mesorhizobium sp. J428]
MPRTVLAKSLILHVGPAKCGSSSIQREIAREGSPFHGHSVMLPLALLQQLIEETVVPDAAARLLDIASGLFACGDQVVISHEAMFQRPVALRNIVALLRPVVEDVTVVGYSRRQSGFIQSAYSQWLFRSPERTSEVGAALRAAGLEPLHFTGLEACFIAAVKTDMRSARQLSNDFILDWHAVYGEIARMLAPFGVKVSAGFIPREGYRFSLLADFYKRCGLSSPALADMDETPANAQFDPDLVEAVHLAVELGLPAPGPHQHAAFFDGNSGFRLPAEQPEQDDFLDVLKDFVDTRFQASNRAFCLEYGLAEEYFRPRRIVTRDAVEEAIAREAQRRRADPDIVLRRQAAVAARLASAMYGRYLEREAKE